MGSRREIFGLVKMHRSTVKLGKEDQKTSALLQAEGGCNIIAHLREDAQDHDIFISLTCALYVVVNSRKEKGKTLKKNIPRGFNARIKEIQEEHNQQKTQLQQIITDRGKMIRAIQYENVGSQGEIIAKKEQIVTLQRRYVGYLSNKDKNNAISIIAKNNEEAEYPYISICGQHGYRRHNTRALLARNQWSTLFADGCH